MDRSALAEASPLARQARRLLSRVVQALILHGARTENTTKRHPGDGHHHNAHLAAAAMAHRITRVITLNGDDFRDFSAHVTCLTPAEAVTRILKKGV